MKTTTNVNTKKHVRFSNSNRSLTALVVVDNLSLGPEASKLWYSQEEQDLFKAWFSHQAHKVRSQIEEHSALLDEELVTIDAAAILGLEKCLSSELTAEYKNRRSALQRAVLEEHRWQRAVQIPHSARLAMISAQNSLWARERARAAALFLEQDVIQDIEEMKLQTMAPRRCSMPHLNKEADTTEKKNSTYKRRPAYQRRWSTCATTTTTTTTTTTVKRLV
jgi:hypothetical protein